MTDQPDGRRAPDVPADLVAMDELLRAWNRTRVSTIAAPQGLAATIAEIPDRSPAGPWLPALPLSRRLQLVLAAGLLLALATGALAVGSGLLHLPWQTRVLPTEPSAFVSGGTCDADVPGLIRMGDAILAVHQPGLNISLGADGHLVTITTNTPPYPAPDATYTDQQLTPSGIAKVAARVRAAGISSGCRSTNLQGMGDGAVFLRVDGKTSGIWWNAGPRRATAAESTAIDALLRDLRDPARWLTADDLVDRRPEAFTPGTWLLDTVVMGDSTPGAGGTGADQVALPGGAALGSFGEIVSVDTQNPATERCALLTNDEADTLMRSLQEAGAYRTDGPDSASWEIDEAGSWEISALPTTDYMVMLRVVPQGGSDCRRVLAEWGQPTPKPVPTPKPLPPGNLARVDACSLLPTDWTGTNPIGAVAFDVQSPVCAAILPGSETDWYVDTVTVTVRGAGTTIEDARHWAAILFGQGLTEQVIAGRTAWFNACATEDLGCQAAVAVSQGPYFYVATYDTAYDKDRYAVLRDFVTGVEIGPGSTPAGRGS